MKSERVKIGKRYIDGDGLMSLNVLGAAARAEIERWLKRQPRAPKLIGRQRAAEILGVGSPYISQLIKSGAMPDAIVVEGGKDAYDETEVKALATRRRRERQKKVSTP